MLRAALAVIALLVLAAPAQAAVPRGWTSTSPLQTARWLHAAVRLDDGRVLVTGGTTTGDASGATRAAELFDPATERWTAAAPMGTSRVGHVLVKLPNGRVLAAGGSSFPETAHNTSEVYDPATNRWEPVADLMSERRYAAAALLLADGSVLVAGGYHGGASYSATAERYLPSGEWTAAGAFDASRHMLALAPLPGGEALVAGGADASLYRDTASVFSGTETWNRQSTMRLGRYGLQLNALPDGRVMATGGLAAGIAEASTELYSPSTRTWSAGATMASAHERHTATTLTNGDVLVASGFTGGGATTTAERYVPSANQWLPAGTLAVGRWHATGTLLLDGRVLVAGGTIGSGAPTAAAELWTPATSLTTDPALTLGEQVTGRAGSAPVQVTNTGDQPLITAEATVSGAHAGDFAVDAQRCRVVAPGATCTLDVRFAPTAAGTRLGILTFAANTAAGTHAIPLSGRGAVPGSVADADGDGSFDSADRCPTLKGPATRAGCPTGLLADPSIRYTRSGKGIRVLAYYVKATTAARVVVTCSNGCRRTVTRGKGSKSVRITRLNRKRLPHGAKITITVSMANRLTTTVTDRISRGRRIEGRPRCTPVGC